MANVITVKSGSSTPTTSNLEKLELGFDKVAKKLYIRCEDEIIQIGTSKAEIINTAFPIKSIFITTNSTNPGAYLGGTWEAFGTGRTLIAVDEGNTNFSTVEKTGGATSLNLAHKHATSEHILTQAEVPQHFHLMEHTHTNNFTISSNSHSHTMYHSHEDTFSISSSGSHRHGLYYRPESNNESQTVGLDSSGSGNDYTLTWNGSKNVAAKNLGTDQTGSHTHTLNGAVSNYSGRTGSGSHTHILNGSISTFSGQTGTYGESGPHSHGDTESSLEEISIQNPYITVYMWKRIS